MNELLDRVEDMLGYIELLGRALTPNEIKKVHNLLVDVGHMNAKMKRAQREIESVPLSVDPDNYPVV